MIAKNTAITFFSHLYLPKTGGIERYTNNFSHELNRLGYKVNIITTNSGELQTEENENGVTLFRLSSLNIINGRFPIPYSLLQFLQIYRLFFRKQNNFVILNSRLFLTSLLGLIFGKLSKSQIILIEHGSGHIEYSNKLFTDIFAFYEHLVTMFYRFAGIKFYGVSKASSEWLTHFGLHSSGEIYNGVNPTLSKNPKEGFSGLNIPYDKKIITYVGRMIKEKGVLELVEAFKQFQIEHPDYRLMLVGEGELEEEIRVLSQDNSSILYLGKQSHEEVIKLLSVSTLFVNPSNYIEGLPTTILEAGMFKLPVISTPNGGAKEVIFDKETGIIIKEGRVNLILKTLEIFAHNQEKGSLLGENLYKLVNRKFAWPLIAREFLDIF